MPPMGNVYRCTAKRQVFNDDLKLSIQYIVQQKKLVINSRLSDPQSRTVYDQTCCDDVSIFLFCLHSSDCYYLVWRYVTSDLLVEWEWKWNVLWTGLNCES